VEELAELFTRNVANQWLLRTKALVALVNTDGALIEWNPAFDQFKEFQPNAATLQEFMTSPSRSIFSDLLENKRGFTHPRPARLELIYDQERRICDCVVITLAGGRNLFCAESVMASQSDDIEKLAGELKRIKHVLEIKQIELEAVMAQVDEIAHTDPLTFLSNRRQIIGDLQREVAACDRYHKNLTVFMVDIDHFKQINDTLGHAAGDQVLRLLANQLREGVRVSDNIGRYGGEEFVILLPETELKGSIRMANRLLKLVRALRVDINHQIVHLSVSIGVAQYETEQETWEELLSRADKALYDAKNTGRDKWSTSKFEVAKTASAK
jgi:diguanylate cyclase